MTISAYIIDSVTHIQETQQFGQQLSTWNVPSSLNIFNWMRDTSAGDDIPSDSSSDCSSVQEGNESFEEQEEASPLTDIMSVYSDVHNLRRQNSETRDRLRPYPPTQQERAELAVRRRAASQMSRSEFGDIRPSFDGRSTRQSQSRLGDTSEDLGQPDDAMSRTSNVLGQTDQGPLPPNNDDNFARTSSVIDPYLHAELEGKWMLNVTMHFRDNSAREKFIITYAEQPNL